MYTSIHLSLLSLLPDHVTMRSCDQLLDTPALPSHSDRQHPSAMIQNKACLKWPLSDIWSGQQR